MRIGIVNDLISARVAMSRVLMSSPDHEVAWTANDGGEAIARNREDRPDLILMDLFMPGIDGVEATRQIMTELPCAILLVTATVSGHLDKVYEAMGHGALDAIDTPVLCSTRRARWRPSPLGQDRIDRPAHWQVDRAVVSSNRSGDLRPAAADCQPPYATAAWSDCLGGCNRRSSRLGRDTFRSTRQS